MSIKISPVISDFWSTHKRVFEKPLANVESPSPHPVYYAHPCSSLGYYRGSPVYNGDPDSNYGPNEQGVNEMPQGEGPINWPDQIKYPFLVFLVFCALHLVLQLLTKSVE